MISREMPAVLAAAEELYNTYVENLNGGLNFDGTVPQKWAEIYVDPIRARSVKAWVQLAYHALDRGFGTVSLAQ